MSIVVYTQAQLKAILATAYAAAAAMPANTDAGSVLGSFMDADTLLALNVQQQILTAQAISRLASSFGSDVDSFVNPFGVFRITASPSGGGVTLTAPSPVGTNLVVPVGGVLSTSTGLLFTIVADTANPYYSAPSNGYLITTGQTTCIVSVVCQTAGSIGNVGVGAISQLYNGAGIPVITGITGVSNVDEYENGVDQESDAALKVRFTFLVSTGRVGTANAIIGAALSVQVGLTVSFGDLVNPTGLVPNSLGWFTVVVNELGQNTGPGAPLLAAVNAAVLKVHSAGSRFGVIAPTLAPINGAGNVTFNVGVDPVAGIAAVSAAYVAYMDNIGMSTTGGTSEVDYFTVAALLLQVPGVKKLDGFTMNSATGDVVEPYGTQIVAGTATFVAA